ncbi:hypothetical protein ACFO0S_09270 [Chryseomicrobium palamuruense]|uniref:N-formylglutamate amidohydrolase n=1 Tax=Chryseomicrobium palamuruense TaxID=682973 RepID=A0ABV8UVA8_9BACL
MKQRIAEMERFFLEELGNQEIGHEFRKGKNKILLSAPHSVSQLREGQPKLGEFRTGVLVQLLGEKTDCHILYKTKNLDDDANYSRESGYREDLCKRIEEFDIRLVLDFHIASSERIFDVEIGTGYGVNILGRQDLLETITAHLAHVFDEVHVDELFAASYEHTVSSTISRQAGIPAIQMEINWDIMESDVKLIQLVDIYTGIIRDLEKKL